MTMNQMRIGESATVKRLDVRGGMRRRLQDLGLIEGTYIECLQKNPFGDPCAYLIRGAVIAIRSDESRRILI
ncbi:MAG: ferrous iron transport protein A [Oscillospiraceae bacterium]|jgi:ferrous iron transport protein A|nr:ferrous iron transport protein A [Oscillospiraceae bacterium]